MGIPCVPFAFLAHQGWSCGQHCALKGAEYIHSLATATPYATPRRWCLSPLTVAAQERRLRQEHVGGDVQALGCSQVPRWHEEHTFGANDCGPSPSPYADYVPLDKLSSLVTLPPSPARAYYAGDCGPSPSPFTDYFRPDKLSLDTSEPLFVPPSPALTASPTYGNTQSGTRPSLLESLAWPQPPTTGAAWPTPASDANVISLASLLQTP